MTWIKAYEFCVLEGRRLVYSTNSMHDHMETEYDLSLITIWTIHKVKHETPKGTRFYENVPYTIGYNLDDLESVLCVYFVYEEFKFKGWEADDCKNEVVTHHVLCAEAVNGITAFPKLTFDDEEVVWTEAKRYCEYTNNTLINLFNEIYYVNIVEDLLTVNLTSMISFWSEPPKYLNVTSSVVSDKSVCEFGAGELISHIDNHGFELQLSDESFLDCSNPVHAITCEKQTEMNLFFEMRNSMIENKVLLKNISVSSTVECEEQCITLITYGIYCAGFNYNWTLQVCSLLANLEDCTCYNFVLSKTEGMSAFLVKPYTIIIGEYKPVNELGSTELQIQDNDNTDHIVTNQQATILVKTATTTLPSSRDGDNAAVTIGDYKPTNELGSTEVRIQDNDNTDSMVTNQQPSTLVKTATTTKPTSTIGGNDAGRLLTITMGLICTVSCVVLVYKAAPILHQVKNMELSLADGQITRKKIEEQLNDAFTIEMSDEDGDRILNEVVITRNIPPDCHMDIIN
ncbi:unnamed protein product [Mytilus coruscus]|uniref:Apple domain-containing protein n=1 Tax=Mytilus coruscus TaxID=42192 RepID=A0A6J8ELD5_MYTCO|nr:unnamed protein product [Mytilus coruscus]